MSLGAQPTPTSRNPLHSGTALSALPPGELQIKERVCARLLWGYKSKRAEPAPAALTDGISTGTLGLALGSIIGRKTIGRP